MSLCSGTTQLGYKCRVRTNSKYCHRHKNQNKSNNNSSQIYLPLNAGLFVGTLVKGKREFKGIYESNDYKYDGIWVNDLPHGHGSLVCLKNSYKNIISYVGNFDKGCFEKGNVTIQISSDEYKKNTIEKIMYTGQVDNNAIPNGKGIKTVYYKNKNISIMNGNFISGQLTGNSIFIFNKKKVYEGIMLNYKRYGKGICYQTENEIYEGDFKNDQKNGNGTITYANKDIFTGEFKNGLKDGSGVLKNEKGIVIKQGVWRKDEFKENDIAKTEDSACKICLEYEGNVMILPCNHFGFCLSCLTELKICPVCREDIHQKIKPIRI